MGKNPGFAADRPQARRQINLMRNKEADQDVEDPDRPGETAAASPVVLALHPTGPTGALHQCSLVIMGKPDCQTHI